MMKKLMSAVFLLFFALPVFAVTLGQSANQSARQTKAFNLGAEAYFNAAKKEGFQVNWVKRDNGGDESLGLKQVVEMIDGVNEDGEPSQRVDALFGSIGDEGAFLHAQITESRGKVLFSPSTGLDIFKREGYNQGVIITRASYLSEVEGLLSLWPDKRSVSVLVVTENGVLLREVYPLAKTAMKVKGVRSVELVHMPQKDTLNKVVDYVRDKKPTGILYLAESADRAEDFVKQLSAHLGYSPLFVYMTSNAEKDGRLSAKTHESTPGFTYACGGPAAPAELQGWLSKEWDKISEITSNPDFQPCRTLEGFIAAATFVRAYKMAGGASPVQLQAALAAMSPTETSRMTRLDFRGGRRSGALGASLGFQKIR